MSKVDDLRKKMKTTPITFTPRQSVSVQPLPEMPVDSPPVPAQAASKPSKKSPVEDTPQELVALFAKIPKEDKRWLDHYRIDTGKELGEIIAEAIRLLKKQS